MTGQVILGSKPKVNFVIGWYIFFTTSTVFPISIQWGFSFVKPRGLISNQPLLLKRTQSPAVALAWFRIKITMDRIVKFCPKYIRLFVFQNTDVSF